MLQITQRQMDILAVKCEPIKLFKNEMVAHCQQISPQLSQVLGEQQLHLIVETAMARAKTYQLTKRGPVRLYIELMFLLGSDFDSDPRYFLITNLLKLTDGQMLRAELIYNELQNYCCKVPGLDSSNAYRALATLKATIEQPPAINPMRFETDVLAQLMTIYPQQTNYAGDQALLKLIQRGRTLAQQHHFDALRGQWLVVMLMFGFGHGCLNDPLYPWIAQTLVDEQRVRPHNRGELLERKTQVWLSLVLVHTTNNGITNDNFL